MLQYHIDAFETAKDMVKTEVNLSFSDFLKPFYLYTDTSDIQSGATLVQDRKPLRFYMRKLNGPQRNYTVR